MVRGGAMSKTLFWYVLKDLLRIFAMASGALAGIMSFAGLLKPLTQTGLDAGQVGAILYYFWPAMSTYSLPVAALFATTMVYGRLSADNELTAMRASGISYWSISQPALLLGLTVSIISLLFLCFLVPVFTLKVEKVIYSNLGKIVATEVETSHVIRLDKDAVHAQGAVLAPADPARPNVQQVMLVGPMIVQYERPEAGQDKKWRNPREFYTARTAVVTIEQSGESDEVKVTATLEGGVKFPRRFAGGIVGGVSETTFGPITLPSPIKENSKFMVLDKLHDIWRDPGQARAVKEVVGLLVEREQQRGLVKDYVGRLKGPERGLTLRAGDETYVITPGNSIIEADEDRIYMTARSAAKDEPRLVRLRNGNEELVADAGQIKLKLFPDPASGRATVSAELEQATVKTGGDVMQRESFPPQQFSVELSEGLKKVASKTAVDYLQDKKLPAKDYYRLKREIFRIGNQVLAEMNNRASFAVSCLILVMVGCALGIMFKSGNFLTAFAVSVVPALISIVLIVTGQHTCENVPWVIDAHFRNPLNLGIALIWSGNVVVFGIAAVLLGKLQRQ
jgi:lipopolysaccharide export LptBFGC system permease protein LptF